MDSTGKFTGPHCQRTISYGNKLISDNRPMSSVFARSASDRSTCPFSRGPLLTARHVHQPLALHSSHLLLQAKQSNNEARAPAVCCIFTTTDDRESTRSNKALSAIWWLRVRITNISKAQIMVSSTNNHSQTNQPASGTPSNTARQERRFLSQVVGDFFFNKFHSNFWTEVFITIRTEHHQAEFVVLLCPLPSNYAIPCQFGFGRTNFVACTIFLLLPKTIAKRSQRNEKSHS